MKTAVIALGGNALIKKGQIGSFHEQIKNIDTALEHVLFLIKKGYRIVITHGNGPHVGQILLQQEKSKDITPPLPLFVCVAMTQAEIGHMIEGVLLKKMKKHKIKKPVSVLLTHVFVEKNDLAFRHPTKPIGPYYKNRKNIPRNRFLIKTDRGYRRIVASPEPKEILERNTIKSLIKNIILIACGGGGIPIIKNKKGFSGVDAVIDKDLAGERLAEIVDAELFIILTNVDNIFLNYKKSNQIKLRKIDSTEAKRYLTLGHFPPGNMGPKITAAIRFLSNKKIKNRKVIITSLDKLEKSLQGKAGTVIVR